VVAIGEDYDTQKNNTMEGAAAEAGGGSLYVEKRD